MIIFDNNNNNSNAPKENCPFNITWNNKKKLKFHVPVPVVAIWTKISALLLKIIKHTLLSLHAYTS